MPSQVQDVAPVVMHKFTSGGVTLDFRQPLSLTPTLEESERYLCLRDKDLGIDVFAMTRERLQANLLEQLDLLWREYATAADDELSAEALSLKQALRSAVAAAGQQESMFSARKNSARSCSR